MIDLMKRLTELDLNSPNVVKEDMKVGDKKQSSTGGTIEKTKTGVKHTAGKNYGAQKQPFNKNSKDLDENSECPTCHKDPCKCDDKADESLEEGLDVASLRYLAGLRNTLAECGMMPAPQNASFSINASAPSGDEVAGMLSQIMNLAGVKPVGHSDMPSHDSGQHAVTVEPGIRGTPDDDRESMRAAMDMMNPPEDEGMMGGAVGAGLGALVGGPLGAAAGGAIGGSMEDESEEAPGGQAEPGTAEPMQSAADQIRSMADQLSDIEDKDELNIETYDNTPADPNKKPEFDSNKMAYNPNAGGHGGAGLANNPRAMSETLEDRLFAEYNAFVSEATMSKAAKGHEKYGKKGMQALAKAGREGKSLDKIRDKFDKYDEATEPKDLPKKGDKLGKEGNAFGKAIRDAKASGAKTASVGGKEISVKETSHQASTTMKHVKNPTAGEKKAAKDIKPGISGYADRVAMLKSAEKDGRLKK